MQIQEDCYSPMLKAEVDKILRDLHNSSHPTKVEYNNCFIIYSKCFYVSKITSSQTFFKPLAYVSVLLMNKIHRAICLAYSCISFVQFQLKISYFVFGQPNLLPRSHSVLAVGDLGTRLRIAVNAICFSSLVNKPLGVLAMVYYPSSLVSNVSSELCHGSTTFPIKYSF